MDSASNRGTCVCGKTISAHINVNKPINHRFTAKGTRVEIHPATDDWMRGDRYGEIVGFVGANVIPQDVKVKLDKSGKTRRLIPAQIRFL